MKSHLKLKIKTNGLIVLCLFSAFLFPAAGLAGSDPLPSWNGGAAKQRILGFVKNVTDKQSKSYVVPEERIATFDNDGTLWSEQPLYFQFAFALDRVKEMAPEHPEWNAQPPFKTVLEGDMKSVLAGGEKGIFEILTATHTGMTTAEFDQQVKTWIAVAKHPRFNKLYTDCIFVPMLELINYLKASGFKTWIVSGGSIGFMRPWTEDVYGIPPEQVVGSRFETKLEMKGQTPVLMRQPKLEFIDDKEGKPVGIHQHIGRRPIAAFGNSDGDLQMLQWAAAGGGDRLMLYVHHTDEIREWAYDRNSSIGRLDKGLDESAANGWVVVDMKKDWNRIYKFEP